MFAPIPSDQREHGHCRERRRAQARPQTEAQIAHQILEQAEAAGIAALFLDLDDVPEFPKCSLPGFVRRHAGREIRFDLAIEMLAQLRAQVLIHFAAPDERFHA